MTDQPPPRMDALTAREQEVLAMVAQGLTNREIGAALFISESTAGVHVSNLMGKLGAASRTEAATIAMRAGLVDGMPAPADAPMTPAADEYEFPAEPMHHPPVRTGWWDRMKAQARRHPRSAAIAAGTVVVLAAVATGLAFAVVTGERPTSAAGGDGSPSPTVAFSASESPTPSAIPTVSPTPSGSASATPTASATASSSATASADPLPTRTPAQATAAPLQPSPTPAGTWVEAGRMIDARSRHTATLVTDGSVIIIGGGNNQTCSATIERYDSRAGTWADDGRLSEGRCEHTATMMSSGSILVTGGWSSEEGFGDPTYLDTAVLYDPESATLSAAPSMSVARQSHSAVLLAERAVLVFGGYEGGGAAAVLTERVEFFEPATGSWAAAGNMIAPRYGNTATVLDAGTVLVAGGIGERGSPLATAELYEPANRTWTSAGTMTTPRFRATAVLLPDGRVLVAGGANEDGELASAETYDPDTGEWTEVQPMHTGRASASGALLTNGQFLAVGGVTRGAFMIATSTAERFDPDTGTWTPEGSMEYARIGHTTTALADGSLLVVGGSEGGTFAEPITERWVPRR